MRPSLPFSARTPLVCLLLVVGLAGPVAGQEPQGQAAAEPVAADAELTNVINMIVARVNGEPILWSELQQEEQDMMPLLRQQIPEQTLQAQMPTLRKNMLRGLIEEKMIQHRAERLGITADPNQIDRAIQNLRQQQGLTTEEQFREALAATGLTVADVREQLRSQIIRSQLVYEEVQRGLFVSDTEIERYYEEHKEELVTPARVRLEQIVFLLEGRDPAAVRAQAEAAVAELRGGATAAEVASKYEGATPPRGTDSFVQVDELNDALAAVVPELEVDAYSDPVQSQFGFHLIRVVERQERQVPELDAVRDQIRNRVQQEKQNERMERYLTQLRDQTHIEILHPRYASLEQEWAEAELGLDDGSPIGRQR